MSTSIRLKRTAHGSTYIEDGGVIHKGEPFYDTNNHHLYVGNVENDVVKDKKHIAEVTPVGNGAYQIGEDVSNLILTDNSSIFVFNYDTDEMTASITGYHSGFGYDKIEVPAIIFRVIDGEVCRFDVTAIEDGALAGLCVTELKIPSSIQRIGEGALWCDGIERVTLPFIGESNASTDNSYKCCLGYVFNVSTSSDDFPGAPCHNTFNSNSYWFRLPTTLKEIEILDVSSAHTGSLACIGAPVSVGDTPVSNPKCNVVAHGNLPMCIYPFAARALHIVAQDVLQGASPFTEEEIQCGGEIFFNGIGEGDGGSVQFSRLHQSSGNLIGFDGDSYITIGGGVVNHGVAVGAASIIVIYSGGNSAVAKWLMQFEQDVESFPHDYTPSYSGVCFVDSNDEIEKAKSTYESYIIVDGEMNLEGIYASDAVIICKEVSGVGLRGISLSKLSINTDIFDYNASFDFRDNITLEQILWHSKSAVNDNMDSPFIGTWANSSGRVASTVVHFGEGVTTIPANLFFLPNNKTFQPIQQVYICGDVTNIGASAFRGCYNLTSIGDDTCLKNVTNVGDYAFAGCASLLSLHIPTNASIGNQVIAGCFRLQKLTIPTLAHQTAEIHMVDEATNLSVDSPIFDGVQYLANYNTNMWSLWKDNEMLEDEKPLSTDMPQIANSPFGVFISDTAAVWCGCIATRLNDASLSSYIPFYEYSHKSPLAHVYEHPLFVVEVYIDGCAKIITTSFFGEIDVEDNLNGVHLVGADALAACNARVIYDTDTITYSAPMPRLITLCGDIGWVLKSEYNFLGVNQLYVDRAASTAYGGPSFNIETIEVVENLSMREKFNAYWEDSNPGYLVWYGANTGLRTYSPGRPEYGGVNLTLPNLERWVVQWNNVGRNFRYPDGWDSTQHLYINQLRIRGGRYWDYVGCKDFMSDDNHPHNGLMELSFDTAPAIKLIDDEADKDTEFGMFSYLIDEEG